MKAGKEVSEKKKALEAHAQTHTHIVYLFASCITFEAAQMKAAKEKALEAHAQTHTHT